MYMQKYLRNRLFHSKYIDDKRILQSDWMRAHLEFCELYYGEKPFASYGIS